MKPLFLISFLLSCIFVSAQEISGIIINPQGVPVTGASISLLKAKDSSLQQMVSSDTSGYYSFVVKQTGFYLLQASHIGFATAYSTPFQIKDLSSRIEMRLVCIPSPSHLEAVIIETKKPLLEVLADKMIVNVEGTINATSKNALEVLRRSPGVNLDNEDNVSLSGKNGVQIFIDGKLSPLSGTDLANYLRTLPASGIETLEIITNPSAIYEAAGNAGIINIRLKKNRSFGTNGTVTSEYGIGAYHKYNGGFLLNYRNKKINVFGNYNYQNNKNLVNTHAYRIQADSVFDQYIRRVVNDEGNTVKAGIDYFVNHNSTVGAVIVTNPSSNAAAQQSNTNIYFQPTMAKNNMLAASNNNNYSRSNIDANINYHYTKGDNEITFDADHASYRFKNEQLQPNTYYSSAGNELYTHTYFISSPYTIKLNSVKLNYSRKIKSGRLDLGGKFSSIHNDNDLQYFDVVNDQRQPDSSRTNQFFYKEKINAVYANYNKAYKKLAFQMGLRIENSNIDAASHGYVHTNKYIGYDSSFKRNYTDLFPSFSVTYKKNQDHQLSVSYSKRIDRPAYQDLNPFEFKIDEYTFRRGNTNLQPQYTNSVGLVYVYKGKLTANLNYSHVKSVFTQVYDTTEIYKSFVSKINLASQKIASLNLSYSLQYGHYNGTINVNNFYSRNRADLGVGRNLNIDIFSTNVQLMQNLKIGKTNTVEMAFYYSSPSIWQGTFKSKPITSIELGMQKAFFNNKLIAKAALWDVFLAYKYHGSSYFAGQYLDVQKTWEPNLFVFNLSYHFGNSQLKNLRQRKTDSEEESSRLQNESSGN